MNPKQFLPLTLLLALVSGGLQANPLGAAFTYQGRLNDGGLPANGQYDLQLALFNVAAGPGQVGRTLTNANVAVSNGLFTTAMDFGAGTFNGTAYWLEIGVRTNGSVAAFTTLSPRQPLTPAPYALFAANTSASANNSISGSYAAASGGYANVSSGFASTIGGGHNNTATNEGATVGGGILNKAIGYAATVAGGNLNVSSNDYATVGGGFENISTGSSATVAGGYGNSSTGVRAFVGGGSGNTSGGQNSVVGGGAGNSATSDLTTVGGGAGNVACGLYATISGGAFNTSCGYAASVPGGYQNAAMGDYSFAAGRQAKATNQGAFVWADSTAADFRSTGLNQFLIRASGGVGIGTNSPTSALSVNGSADFSGAVGIGTLPTYGLDVNKQLVVYDNDLSFRRSGSHRWRLTTPPAGFEILQEYNTSGTDVHQLRFIVADSGNVGIGVNNPGMLLDVGGRMRMRDGGGSAGLWLNTADSFGAGGVADIAFIGVLDPTRIGFYGNDPRGIAPGWGLTFDTVTGNVGIGTGTTYPGSKLQVVNATCDGNNWNNSSDRNLKENFKAVDPREVLASVAALPISRWNYKNDPDTPHLGPVAQDFHAAFELGADDRHIATVDADGVAMAAIQGLNEIVAEKDLKITQLQKRLCTLENVTIKEQASEIDQLRNRLSALEKLLAKPSNQ